MVFRTDKRQHSQIEIPHPITYQNGTFKGSQKNWSTLTKEAYSSHTPFQEMVFYLKEAHIIEEVIMSPSENLGIQ